MKKLFILFAALFAVTTASAQHKGDMGIGVLASYGISDEYMNVGVGVKFQYNVADAVRIEPSFIYNFDDGISSMLEANVNVHYQFTLTDRFTIYPLVGANFVSLSGSYYDDSGEWHDNFFNLNIGAGFDYKITSRWVLNGEIQGKLIGWLGGAVSAGVTYKF